MGVLDAADGGARLAPEMIDKARAVVDVHRAAFHRAVETGVRIAMGTDSGVTPHGRNLRELPLMAAGGMSPRAVLHATTRSAAELLGVADEVGTLEPGTVADFVVVDGDPFDLDALPERVAAVYPDGTRAA
jgi:imidazolonepropionase-like amidohydrolase